MNGKKIAIVASTTVAALAQFATGIFAASDPIYGMCLVSAVPISIGSNIAYVKTNNNRWLLLQLVPITTVFILDNLNNKGKP